MAETCQLCGNTMGRITGLHLKGPKCKPHNGKRLTLPQYRKEFGEHTAEGDAPPPKKKRNVLKLLRGLDAEEITAAIAELDEQIAALTADRDLLARLLPDDRPTLADAMADAAGIPTAKKNGHYPQQARDKVLSALESAGPCSMRDLERHTGMPPGDVRLALERLEATKSVKSIENGRWAAMGKA